MEFRLSVPVELQFDGVTQSTAEFGDVRIVDVDCIALDFLKCHQIVVINNLPALISETEVIKKYLIFLFAKKQTHSKNWKSFAEFDDLLDRRTK